MTQLDEIADRLDRLASFDPGPYPVVSLYLDLRADQHGRDNFETFVRKELRERLRTYPASGPERAAISPRRFSRTPADEATRRTVPGSK